jgi:L,D-transpeptidase YcbB
VRADFIAGVVLALIASSARAEPAHVAGQPVLRAPGSAAAQAPAKAPAKAPAQAPAHAPAAAKPSLAAKPPRATAKAPSTPESRSAAALALSADPVFDEGTYQRIKAALLSYADIQVRGGWPALPADAKLVPGVSGPEVTLLRKRLVISDDLAPEQEEGDTYDAALADAVKRFQLRHGLDATGSVSPQTLRALNIPVAARIKQLEASIERLLGMDFVFAERYVVVNIPAAYVEAVSHDKVERRYRVIVGKVDKPSPTLTAYITAVNLNPTWTVPLSITKNEIFRHMRKDPTYLSRMHMRVLGARDEDVSPQSIDWSSDRSPNFTIRQDSGTFNALGNLKIDMPNPYSVYMHDTNTRNLFADDYRFDSHGCTRVDNVRDLATWILQDVPGWNRAAIDAGIAAGVLKVVNLPHKMPVAWVYLTGWVTRDGTIQFREDVYKHDDSLDRNALADAAAGGFVAPVARDAKQVSNLDSR